MEEGIKTIYRTVLKHNLDISSKVYASADGVSFRCLFIKVYVTDNRAGTAHKKVLTTLMPVMKVGELTEPVKTLEGLWR